MFTKEMVCQQALAWSKASFLKEEYYEQAWQSARPEQACQELLFFYFWVPSPKTICFIEFLQMWRWNPPRAIREALYRVQSNPHYVVFSRNVGLHVELVEVGFFNSTEFKGSVKLWSEFIEPRFYERNGVPASPGLVWSFNFWEKYYKPAWQSPRPEQACQERLFSPQSRARPAPVF